MNLRFTKYGAINALLSLIPIFPLWTLFPGVLIALGIEKCLNNCILGYQLVMFLSIFLVIGATAFYLSRINRLLFKDVKVIRQNFRLFSLFIYTFSNTAALIIILSPNLACNGSSMSIMACVFSAPIASIALIILGFLIDLKIKIYPPELNVK